MINNVLSKHEQNNKSYGFIWESIKKEVKIYSIKYATTVAKKKCNEFKLLEDELQTLNKDKLSNCEIVRKENIAIRLAQMYDDKCRGAQVRARVKWLNEDETNSKYFLGLEKSRQSHNVIESIKLNNGQVVTHQNKVLREIGNFYKNLYETLDVSNIDIVNYLNNFQIPTLTNEQRNSLENMPSENELQYVLSTMKQDRAPGIDGIPAEFFQSFWYILKNPYINMINECWALEDLPLSMKTAILALIHKAHEKDKLKNYRPISLLNTDYKLLAFVFAERLQKVLKYIVHDNQSGYIRGRYIGCNIRQLLDLFEITENDNIPGAFINIDFEKAFDCVEHNFMFEVLKRFNFGTNFIKWITILYNNPIFRVKNNGWISQTYNMKRGQRQGCPLSALIFILIVEVLAISIRSNNNIKGIKVGLTEHKIVQYADDATLILGNIESIEVAVDTINQFSKLAGPKLNIEKTKGIWLGSLKDLGLRKYHNILWTGKPVKCLGIYLGHDTHKCRFLNWDKKLESAKKVLATWNQRAPALTIKGKILVIKTLVLSKMVFPASLLEVPDYIVKELNKMMFTFIWGKTDRIKRSQLINTEINGGMNMVHIESFFASLKAAWVTKLKTMEGEWQNVLTNCLEKHCISLDYIMRTTFKTVSEFPIIRKIPVFYQEAFLAFNNVKTIKPFSRMSDYEMLHQPIHGNCLFKWKEKCLYLKSFLDAGIMYVKDIVNKEGTIMSDNELYESVRMKQTVLHDMYILKNTIIRKLYGFKTELALYIKKAPNITILVGKELHVIDRQKSKFFYKLLHKNHCTRPDMERIWSSKFAFENMEYIWKNIYRQKIFCIVDNKLSEFYFKLLNNIVPCGYILSKWNYNVNDKCDVCNEIETTYHMLYDCNRIKLIWKNISNVLNIDVTWKHLVCGFVVQDISDKVLFYNTLFVIILYAIFKCNNNCKHENVSYSEMDIMLSVKRNLVHYKNVLLRKKEIVENDWRCKQFDNCIAHLM